MSYLLPSMTLTAKGRRLYGKAHSGECGIEFTKIAVGTGYIDSPDEVAALAALKSEVNATVSALTIRAIDDSTVCISARITAADAPFYMREIGLIANDPDEGSILYGYCNFADTADYVETYKGLFAATQDIDIYVAVGNSANFSVDITEVVTATPKDVLDAEERLTAKIEAEAKAREAADGVKADKIYNEGFIGGKDAALKNTGGAAVGLQAQASKGLAGGSKASAAEGCAAGSGASASHGVAAGRNAKTLHGAALGDGAKTVDEEGNPITAVQLGEGTNSDPNTFRVFSYQMMDANGHIPPERINKAITQSNNNNSDNVATTAFVLNRILDILSRSGIVTLSKIKINFRWVLGSHGSTDPTCTFEYTDIQGADITDWYAGMSGCKYVMLTDTTATTRALWIGISKTNKSVLYVGVTDGSVTGSGYDDLPDGYNFTRVKSYMTFPSSYIGTYDLETGTITEEV